MDRQFEYEVKQHIDKFDNRLTAECFTVNGSSQDNYICSRCKNKLKCMNYAKELKENAINK